MDMNKEYSIIKSLILKSNQLQDEYNSGNYILGMHNVKAYKLVAIHLLDDVATVRPIFICGEERVGKSHLFQATIRDFRNE